MVKNHSDSERGNPLLPHRLLFPISSKGFFYMHHPADRITHTTAFVTQVVGHWLEREISHWIRSMKDRSDDPSHHERTLLPRSYISLHTRLKTAMLNIMLPPCFVINNSHFICFIIYLFIYLSGNRCKSKLSVIVL